MYQGQIANIPIGTQGLVTDLPQNKIDPTRLIRAENITIHDSILQKDTGSIRWNVDALPAGVVQAIEWRPDIETQRVIVVCKDGKVYRFKNQFSFTEVTAESGAPLVLDVSGIVTMVPVGQEETGNPRKLFIFTGANEVQVITGDGTTRRNISAPPADWTGLNQPIFGTIHLGRLFAFGNKNQPHRTYVSSGSDHEDFTSATLTFEIDPGEGSGLIASTVFRSRLYFIKNPVGLYHLKTPTLAESTWIPERLFTTFGGVSPTGLTPVLGDFLVANDYGSITSVLASDVLGDVDNIDLFHVLGVQRFTRDQISKSGATERHAVYYRDKKEALFTFRSLDSTVQNRICRISYKDPRNPQVMWLEKDQPNCLFLLKDVVDIERPAYGADDGFIYVMDSPNRWVGALEANKTEYEMVAQTPHMDLGFQDKTVSEQVKLFDFLEVTYLPTGRYTLEIDVFIDEKFSETKKIELSGRTSELNASKLDAIVFDEEVPRPKRVPLHGSGRRISLRARLGGFGNAMIIEFKIYFRLAGQRQKG